MEKKQLAHLTGFRAIAAYFVLIAHSADTAFSYSGVPVAHQYVVYLAYFGMSVFFVLSGFVIFYNYSGKFHRGTWARDTYEFAVARFARLFPLYAVFLLLSLQYIPSPTFLDKTGGFEAVAFGSYLTLTQSWFNLQSITFAPAWSISTECFFYLCFALCMALPSRARPASQVKKSAVIACVVILAALCGMFRHQRIVTQLLEYPFKMDSSPNVWAWLTYYSPYVRVCEFIMGASSAKLYLAMKVSVRSYQSRRPTDRTRSGPTCHPIPEPFPTSASVVLTPSARRSHDAPAVLLSGGSPSAATRRGDAAARAPGGSRPTGPGATTPGPSRRR